MSICGKADAYVEGLLSPSEEQAFLAHITGCARCQQDLEEDTQLRALEDQLRRVPEPRIAPPRPRRRRVLVAALSAMAAAAILLVYLASRSREPQPGAAPLLALAAQRTIEGRLSYAAADRYRPYDVARGGTGAAGDITPPEKIAELSQRGDTHGVASAYLLAGDYGHAAEYLKRTPSSPDVDSDRALLKLLDGRPEDALDILDEVLRRVPQHPQALWNRGLALQQLGLSLAAAESFTRVADIDPGWREEAQARATKLREQSIGLKAAWGEAEQAGNKMVEGGPPLPPEMARRFPGMSRVFFHQALRLAPSRERVDELAPLAQELDRAHGGTELSAALSRARTWPFEARRPLLGDYLDFVKHRSKLDDAGWRRWLDQARKAGADDLILGAIVHTRRTEHHLDELRRAAQADGSPWALLYARTEEAKALLRTGERLQGEQLLNDLLEQCNGMRVPYRCMLVEIELTKLNLAAHRLQAARVHAEEARRRADLEHEWGKMAWLAGQLGEVERLRHRFAQARAYYEEALLGSTAESCEADRNTRLSLAGLYVSEGRPDDARREAAAARTCSSPLSLTGLIVHLDLHRMGQPVLSEETLRHEIEDLRTRRGVSKGERLYADWAEARLVIDRDPARGEELLRAVIQEAARLPGDMTAAKVRSYAYTMLLVDAARRGAYDRMAPLLAEAQGGGNAPDACWVAIARDDLRLAVAVRGPSGAVAGAYDERSLLREGASLIPSRLQALLEGCAAIRVLAQPPLTGTPRLLPPTLAWSYDVALGPQQPEPTGAPRRVIVTGAKAPQTLKLPPLADWELPEGSGGPQVTRLHGSEANPRRVLAELTDATELEFHVHAISDTSLSDAPVLALSPDGEGKWALTAEAIRANPLRRHPLVLLANCRAGELADWMHEAWGLPTAFLQAGASTVVASSVDVPDRDAVRFFDAVVARIRAGEAPVSAVAAERRLWLERQPESWVADVLVFE
jgi:tetratricopeptide (TPR) repeat protein